MINFDWDVHQENLVFLGMQGSGKTTKAGEILAQIPRTHRIIVSPINRKSWRPFGDPVEKISDLGPGAWLWDGPNDVHTFEKICTVIMDRIPNCVLVVDDLQEYVSKQKIPPAFNSLIQSGRNRGICSMWISPSPNLISNYVLQSAQHIFAFKLNLYSQIEWMERNFFGPDAQILIPPERRTKRPTIADLAVFPKYAFLYRSYKMDHNELSLPPGAQGAAPAPEAPAQGGPGP